MTSKIWCIAIGSIAMLCIVGLMAGMILHISEEKEPELELYSCSMWNEEGYTWVQMETNIPIPWGTLLEVKERPEICFNWGFYEVEEVESENIMYKCHMSCEFMLDYCKTMLLDELSIPIRI